jgi:hypothetical protein
MQSAPSEKRRTVDQNAPDRPMTPESESSEIEETLGSMIDTDGVQPTAQLASTPNAHSMTTLAMDEENAAKSETIHCSTMPISPNRERTESPSVPDPTESVSFLDMVHQMVDIVHLLNRYRTDLPRTAHQRILHSLHTTQEPIMDSTAHPWSDGRMWMEVLGRGSATNRRCSVHVLQ